MRTGQRLYDSYAVIGYIKAENGIDVEGIAYRMNRSKVNVYSVIRDVADKADIFAEILDEFGYDVIIRKRATGEERRMNPPKQYKRNRGAN